MSKPLFVTGNQYKADYLANMLGVELEHRKIELDEIQSTSLEEIVEHKVKQAYEQAGQPVIVDDVGLRFTALGGLPGPFIKFFVESENGLEHLCRMLDGFSDRTAHAECVYGYYNGERLELFRGGLDGVIVQHPRGEGGFGWDKIFAPNGYDDKTRAELSPADDEVTYRRIKPYAELRAFLATRGVS